MSVVMDEPWESTQAAFPSAHLHPLTLGLPEDRLPQKQLEQAAGGSLRKELNGGVGGKGEASPRKLQVRAACGPAQAHVCTYTHICMSHSVTRDSPMLLKNISSTSDSHWLLSGCCDVGRRAQPIRAAGRGSTCPHWASRCPPGPTDGWPQTKVLEVVKGRKVSP